MKFLKFLTAVSLIFLLHSFCIAQKPELVFHQLSTKDGLSQNTVRAIIEDKTGFMWFGTEDGANRFDGYEFQAYRNNPKDPYSISHSYIKCLYLDHKETLWIGTVEGMNIYDSKTDKFYNFKSNKYPALKFLNGDMDAICQDSKNNYWVISTWQGLYKISDLNKKAEKYYSTPSDQSTIFTTIAMYDDETIYIGTNTGLLKFNTKTKKIEDLRSRYGHGYHVNKIFIEPEKNIWVCTTDGLKVIRNDGTFKEYHSIPEDHFSIIGNNVGDILPYKDGNYLIGIDGGGIEYFDTRSERFYHYTSDPEIQLSGNNIIDLYKDYKGGIWAGTFMNGVNLSNSTTNLFVLIKNHTGSDKSIPKGIVNFFHKDKGGDFLIGTDGGGLYKKENNSDKFINYHHRSKPISISSNALISITEDKDGLIYFTSWGGGLTEYNPKTDNFKVYKHHHSDPFSISNDKTKAVHIYKDQIWISGFGNGISVMDKKTKKFHHYRYKENSKTTIPTDWVQSFFTDKNGVLWLATFYGLSRYIPETDNFQNYLFEDNIHLNGNALVDIEEDNYGNLWLGSISQGLILFNRKDGSFKKFTIENGLTDNNIKSILKDDYDNIWITTNNGITKLHVPSMKFKPYTFKDGVPFCAFTLNSKWKDSDGSLYFGTNNGYLIINPSLATTNKNIPPVVITELKIFNEIMLPEKINSPLNKSIFETSEITLPYDQNSLSFEFAALNFNNSQNNKYAYILEGFDNKWVKVSHGHRSATYTNLNPGTYKFKVIASNNDNVWNNKGANILITITPPFYKTWWFYILAIMSVMGLLYTAYTRRLKNIKIKNQVLEKIVRQRTQELNQKTQELKESNEHLEVFVYKASHDIKGPLKSIIGLTTVGQKDVKDEAAKTYFEHILKSTKKLDNLLQDLLEVTKVKQAIVKREEINFKDMVSEALMSFENLPEYSSMKFNININQNGSVFYSDKKLLYSLIQNLVENPIKYRDPDKKESRLDINIDVSKKMAKLIFKDNGIGIPQDRVEKIFDMFYKVNEKSNGTGLGLYIVKTTVEKLKGTIKVESKEGEGSTFFVNL